MFFDHKHELLFFLLTKVFFRKIRNMFFLFITFVKGGLVAL